MRCELLELLLERLAVRMLSTPQPSYRDLMNDLKSGGTVYVDAAERAAYYVRGTRWVGFEIEETLWMKVQVCEARWGKINCQRGTQPARYMEKRFCRKQRASAVPGAETSSIATHAFAPMQLLGGRVRA